MRQTCAHEVPFNIQTPLSQDYFFLGRRGMQLEVSLGNGTITQAEKGGL